MVDLPNNIPPQAGDPPPPKAGRKPSKVAQAAAPIESVLEEDADSVLDDIEASEASVSLTPEELKDIIAAAQAAKYKRSQPPPMSAQRMVMPSHKGMPTMRILLEDNPDIPPSGQFIGHNGVSYLLRTGVWVDVPLPIIEILNHAVMMVPERNASHQVVGWREKLRYPYRVAPGQAPYPLAA